MSMSIHAECHFFIVMLIVFTTSVAMLSVMAP